MGEFDDGFRGLVAVADERERELAGRIVFLAEELHSEDARVETPATYRDRRRGSSCGGAACRGLWRGGQGTRNGGHFSATFPR